MNRWSLAARAASAALLLLLAAGGIFSAVYRAKGDCRPAALRTAGLTTAVLVGLLLVGSIETLGAFSALDAPALTLFWGIVAAVSWSVYAVLGRDPGAGPSPFALLGVRLRALQRLTGELTAILVLSGMLLGLTLVVAVAAPPNDWDSMTYHMARVGHWLANESVRHYPTANVRQLQMPPFAEYAIATLQALAGSDVWANAVQWLAYAGTAAAVSLIVSRIGGSVREQIIATLVFLTVPMAVLQASTTQTDLVTAFWLTAFVAFAFGPPERWANRLGAGVSLGLGLLTKPTAAFFGLPLGVLLVAQSARQGRTPSERVRRAASVAATVAVLAGVIVAPHALRNLRTFGNLHGSTRGLTNEAPGPLSTASTVLRQLAMHLPLAGEPVVRLHGALGLDPEDPRTTWSLEGSFADMAIRDRGLRAFSTSETRAGAPLHLLASFGLLGLALGRRSSRPTARAAIWLGVAAAAGWLVMLTVLKWQPWAVRFDLVLFTLLSVPIGVGIGSAPAWVARPVLATFVLGVLPCLLLAQGRPFVNCEAIARWPTWVWILLAVAAVIMGQTRGASRRGRSRPLRAAGALAAVGSLAGAVWVGALLQQQRGLRSPASVLTTTRAALLFRGRPDLAEPYRVAGGIAKDSGCPVIGLELGFDDWEYPLWWLLDEASGRGTRRLLNVGVRNPSSKTAAEGPEPCIVISTVRRSGFENEPGWSLEPIAAKPPVAVYRRRKRS